MHLHQLQKLHADMPAVVRPSYVIHIGSAFETWLQTGACMQAGAGLVADSVPESEYEETVNKAAALGRAIDLAEQAFVDC